MSFTVSPGEVEAICGPSGSGKTSIVHLIERFYAQESGQILLDDVPIENYNYPFLHKSVPALTLLHLILQRLGL